MVSNEPNWNVSNIHWCIRVLLWILNLLCFISQEAITTEYKRKREMQSEHDLIYLGIWVFALKIKSFELPGFFHMKNSEFVPKMSNNYSN